jgi:hypothetical protein
VSSGLILSTMSMVNWSNSAGASMKHTMPFYINTGCSRW